MFEKYLTKSGKLSCKQPQEIKNQWYTEKFKQVHGDKYDYSLMCYTTSRALITIICPEHGEFEQTAQNHQSGRGCPSCQKVKTTKTTGQIIAEFREVHGDRYDYLKVIYVSQHAHVSIDCKYHGVFPQSPHHHLKGVGCPKCQRQNQDTVYLMRCNNTGLTKIGISNNVERRRQEIGGNLTILASIQLENPRQVETSLHQRFSHCRVTNPKVNNGKTEFFNLTDYQVSELIQELRSL